MGVALGEVPLGAHPHFGLAQTATAAEVSVAGKLGVPVEPVVVAVADVE